MRLQKGLGTFCLCMAAALLFAILGGSAANGEDAVGSDLPFPPKLPGGRSVVTDTSEKFLEPPETLQPEVATAETSPTIDFLFYPGQDYVGRPWSNWGEGWAVEGKYYSAIGDHLALGRDPDAKTLGNAFVYEYDAEQKSLSKLVDLQEVLDRPPGHYTPGKIHAGLALASDGWLYFATHRGSSRATTPEFRYRGDWILRTHPKTGQSEIVAHAPVPGHCIPAGMVDTKRMIFYCGTRAGRLSRGVQKRPQDEQFLAYDLKERRVLYAGPKASAFGLALSRSTGRVYYTREGEDGEVLVRFDPEVGKPVEIEGDPRFIGHATAETQDGYIYSASFDREVAGIWSLHVPTERIEYLGPAHVGEKPRLIASIAVDPNGRYLYYTPGAHGGSERAGTPIVQFDVRTKQRKVLAFLEPFYQNKYGCLLKGTYSVAIDPSGERLYVTWNVSRTSRVWDCCALTVIHLPESERPVTPRRP